jgi:hypothetical protein
MEIIVIIASLLAVVLPISLLVIGIQREKKKRVEERNEIFAADEPKLDNRTSTKRKKAIDAVDVTSKILQDEVKKSIKSKTEPAGKKPIKNKKPEFPIEPAETIKTKNRRGRKPGNNKKGGDQMLLS